MFIPIILAAGESKRMGIPKALLDFGGTSCLELVMKTCLHSKAGKPIVVLGHEADRIRARCDLTRATVAENKKYALGQTSSLLAGLSALPPEAKGFILFPVDHPLGRSRHLNRLIEAAAGPHKIVIPIHDGRRGHPVLFDRTLIAEFKLEEPAYTVVRRDPARVLELSVDHPGVVTIMNTPEEYQKCKEAYSKNASA